MKIYKFLCIAAFTLLFSCRKEEQKLVIESAYTVGENGTVKPDHREAFVGSYRLNCMKKNLRYGISQDIKALSTRSNMILLQYLYSPEGVYENKFRHEVAAEISGTDSFIIRSQFYKIDSDRTTSQEIAGRGFLYDTDSIEIFFTVTDKFSLDTCLCKGRKF